MKNHLPLLKETLQFMVQQLRSDDKLCIVTFDHEVLECIHTRATQYISNESSLHLNIVLECVYCILYR